MYLMLEAVIEDDHFSRLPFHINLSSVHCHLCHVTENNIKIIFCELLVLPVTHMNNSAVITSTSITDDVKPSVDQNERLTLFL